MCLDGVGPSAAGVGYVAPDRLSRRSIMHSTRRQGRIKAGLRRRKARRTRQPGEQERLIFSRRRSKSARFEFRSAREELTTLNQPALGSSPRGLTSNLNKAPFGGFLHLLGHPRVADLGCRAADFLRACSGPGKTQGQDWPPACAPCRGAADLWSVGSHGVNRASRRTRRERVGCSPSRANSDRARGGRLLLSAPAPAVAGSTDPD